MTTNQTEKTPPKTLLLCYLFLIIAFFFWGISNIFAKQAQMYADPVLVLAHRFTLAAIVLTIMMLISGGFRGLLSKMSLPVFLLCVTDSLIYVTEGYALYYSNATFVGVVGAIAPLFCAFFGAVFIKEYPGKLQLIFSIFPIIGVIIVTLNGSSLGVVHTLAIVFMLIYLTGVGAYRTTNRFCASRLSVIQRTWLILTTTSLTTIGISLFKLGGNLHAYFAPVSEPRFVVPVVLLALFCSIICNLCVNYSAVYVSVLTLSTFGSLNTIFAILGGVFYLHEPFTFTMVIGSALVVVGIFLATIYADR